MTSPVVSGAQGDGGRMDDETLAKIARLWSRDGGMGNDRSEADYTDEGCRVLARHAFRDVNDLLRELGDTRARLARAAAIEREARTVAGYLAVHGPRVVYYRLATALGATDQAGGER